MRLWSAHFGLIKDVNLFNVSVWPAGRVLECGRYFNNVIFLNAINMVSVKLCMVVILVELYSFIPLSVTLIVFQGHSNIQQF